MLYIVGLGLNEKGISIEGKEILSKCKKIYLENYTVEFPYKLDKLEKVIGKKVYKLDRNYVESSNLVLEAKKEDISLLVYGSPLFATTHISLIEECRKNKIKYKVIYAASVFDAIAESGLQLYKFGKITSMPDWKNSPKTFSFLEIVKENKNIGAHSLILVDIELNFSEALNQLDESFINKNFDVGKILVCSKLGVSSKFCYDEIKNLKNKKINPPFCFVIPGKMHFLEEEILEKF